MIATLLQRWRQGFSYASFNAFTARPGSRLADASADVDRLAMDPSRPGFGESNSAAPVERWVRRAYRRFYLRPGIAGSALRCARAAGGFRAAAAMGSSLLHSMKGGR